MNKVIKIKNKTVCDESKTFIIAEMSGNHNMNFDRAVAIIKAAKDAGADAIKLQTYTADTITMDSDNECFKTQEGSLWEGMTLYQLYQKAYTPWEWQSKLKMIAEDMGLICFSSPFDLTAVDFLENLNVPAYKIASFEINDIPLLRKIAKTQKPIIISTGIAHMEDIETALSVCREENNNNVILLKCTSAYPSPYEEMNLKVIPNMKETFECIVGLSDHTLGTEVSVAAVALGAKVIEKHLTISRADGGPDAEFSMEPQEFKQMVEQIRNVEKALGMVTYKLTEKQVKARLGSRSIFAVKDIKAGEPFTLENIRSIRPGNGMHTKYFEQILGKKAKANIDKGTPMDWQYIE